MAIDSRDASISVIGLPESGKTTFLAALWHLVQSDEIVTKLKFGNLKDGNYEHLNKIVKQWRSAYKQERTKQSGLKSVSMNLIMGQHSVRVVFPDVPGEDYRRMWEDRVAETALVDALGAQGVVLLLNGDTVAAPAWVSERAALMQAIGDENTHAEEEGWHPKHAPTQVQLVDLLQQLSDLLKPTATRKLAVMVSAWDTVEAEGLDPESFIQIKLPLLHQYLFSRKDLWESRIYGVSAQGGEYDGTEQGDQPTDDAVRLRGLDIASSRIRLIFKDSDSHDLTEPLEWLMN